MNPLSGDENREVAFHRTDDILYSELEVGDRFVFLYPHHGEQLWAWLYVRTEEGHHRINDSTLLSPISKRAPLSVKRVSSDVPYENGMILLSKLE